MNLVYTVMSLGLVTVLGGVCMAVYLAEYRRRGDVRRALATAARFHADYNLAVLLILLPLLLLSVLLVFLVGP